jgi:general secretion pathway protein M
MFHHFREWISHIRGDRHPRPSYFSIALIAAVLIPFILIIPIVLAAKSSEKELRAQRMRLREISTLISEYRSLKGHIDSLEVKESLSKVSGIAQALDDTVTSVGMKGKIKSVKVLGQREVKDAMEETADIYIERLTMNELINLFCRIEEAPFLFSMKGCTIKKTFENPELLNVTMSIALYRKK